MDESLPRAVTRALSEAGHDTLDVRDIGLRGATDSVIAAHALAEGRVLVAGDTDFANALRFPPATHPGIVVLRLPNAFAPEERAKRLLSALDPSILSTLAGSIVIVEVARVRVLSVPITP